MTFTRPLGELVARSAAEVLPLLREVERLAAAGQWLAGFLAYEAAPGLDPALPACPPAPGLPLAWFGVFAPPSRTFLAAALGELAAGAAGAVGTAPPVEEAPGLDWRAAIDEPRYGAAVAAVRRAIAAGETYQVNFTWRLRAPFAGRAGALFAALWERQPVPHAAWLDLGDHALMSLSPELLFRRRGERLLCRPMKGTQRRGRYPAEDATLAAELRGSAKERAENLMIVDMVRNDLGRVARAGSVAVPRLFRLERYATVWQLTSTVTGESAAPLPEVLAALFPSASVTGAPKASTMRLIAELEGEPRGPYCGAIGWVGPGRRARFNVAIRTVWVDRRRGLAEYGTGGGVTWDSSVAGELAESRLKAAALLVAPRRYQLLETMLWRPRRGYWLLAEHLRRLRASARHLGFRWPPEGVESRLALAARHWPARPHRVQLRLARDGRLTVEAVALPPEVPRAIGAAPRPQWQVGLARSPIDPGETLLFHKTTWREPYERARAEAPAGLDDVLLWAPGGELTESTVANLVVQLDGRLVTPPVASGLLAGTLRARLLARGRIVERVVRRADLERAGGLWLINSLRGWIRARLR